MCIRDRRRSIRKITKICGSVWADGRLTSPCSAKNSRSIILKRVNPDFSDRQEKVPVSVKGEAYEEMYE